MISVLCEYRGKASHGSLRVNVLSHTPVKSNVPCAQMFAALIRPIKAQKSSQFFQKIWQNHLLAPLLEGILDPPLIANTVVITCSHQTHTVGKRPNTRMFHVKMFLKIIKLKIFLSPYICHCKNQVISKNPNKLVFHYNSFPSIGG